MAVSNPAVESAAKELGVTPAHVWAVLEVETTGSGMLSDGRPKILFERHIMYKQLSKNISPTVAAQSAKKYPNIVSTKNGGYSTGATSDVRGKKEHDRLSQATAIDRQSGLESASWGLPQIMGFHWQSLGYESIQGFINDMWASEDRQLQVFVKFIKVNKNIWNALKATDWAKFAKYYNGSNYAVNQYDIKLAMAFKKHGGK